MSRTTYPRQQDGSEPCDALIEPHGKICQHPLREHAFKGEQRCLRCECPGAVPSLGHDYQAQGRPCPECGGKVTFVRWPSHVRNDASHEYDGWRCAECGHEWRPALPPAGAEVEHA